ncbi:molybdenum cofactor biosynthesis protein MoaE, partial [Ralstonia sp. VS2407]
MTTFTESRAGLPDDPLRAASPPPPVDATDPHPESAPAIAAGFEVRVQHAPIDAG